MHIINIEGYIEIHIHTYIMHKKPTEARFIIAAIKFSLKPSSKVITVAFKMFLCQIKSCNNSLLYFLEYNNFWTNIMNQQLIKGVDNINRRTRDALISSLDFSSFNTNNLHNNLFKVLFELIYFGLKANKGGFFEFRLMLC